jgi:hypothetical protein
VDDVEGAVRDTLDYRYTVTRAEARGAFLGLASFGWAVTFGVLAVGMRDISEARHLGLSVRCCEQVAERVLRAALGES